MKTKQTLVCGTRNLCFALAAIFALAFIACDDGSGDDKTAKKKFTVTFNSDGGSDVSAQTVTEGGKAAKPEDPTKASGFMAGLWTGTPPSTTYTFAGWQKDGAAYDFDTPVTANITLTATWVVPSSVPASLDLSAASGDNIIAKSVAYINDDTSGETEYILVLDADVNNVAAITHNKNSVTLTVTSANETERTISKGTEIGTVFTVGGTYGYDYMMGKNVYTLSSAKLVIDGNITLQGKADNNAAVVHVMYGGRLELKGSAKITGNTNTKSPSALGGGVSVEGWAVGDNPTTPDERATITMSDNAEISGNTVSGTIYGTRGGGVYLPLYGFADLTMSGNAAIKNNTASCSGSSYAQGGGVYLSDDNTFTMNGGEISGNTATSFNNVRGGGVCIDGLNNTSPLTTQFIVASEAVKANIKDNIAFQGAQVYKSTYGVFTVGDVEQDAGTAKGYDSWD